MRFSEPIDPVYLLSSLNAEREFGAERRVYATGPIKARKMAGGSWEGLLPASDEDYLQAGRILVAELRGLVDQWLDTGHADGIETPKVRSLERALPAYRAMTAWALRHRPTVIPAVTGELMVTVGWAERRTDGQDAPKADAREEARRIFVLLMGSAVKYSLFKCNASGCGRYYILEKPRKTYKRATYCPQHGAAKAHCAEQKRGGIRSGTLL